MVQVDEVRLAELENGHDRGSRAIYKALTNTKLKPIQEAMLPFVRDAYLEEGKLTRSEGYIKKKTRKVLKWLTY